MWARKQLTAPAMLLTLLLLTLLLLQHKACTCTDICEGLRGLLTVTLTV